MLPMNLHFEIDIGTGGGLGDPSTLLRHRSVLESDYARGAGGMEG